MRSFLGDFLFWACFFFYSFFACVAFSVNARSLSFCCLSCPSIKASCLASLLAPWVALRCFSKVLRSLSLAAGISLFYHAILNPCQEPNALIEVCDTYDTP